MNKLEIAKKDGMIIGNVTSDSKLYHTPKMSSYASIEYDADRGDQLFPTEEDARAAGFEKANVIEKTDEEMKKEKMEKYSVFEMTDIIEVDLGEMTAEEKLKVIVQEQKELAEADETYIPMRFEIIDGKLFTCPKGEAKIAKENASNIPEEKQKKYFGKTEKERSFPSDHEGEAPEGFEILDKEYTNPYTGKTKVVKILRGIKQDNTIGIDEDLQNKINKRVLELKGKVLDSKITPLETEELKLLAL